jgi:hypothetical protein
MRAVNIQSILSIKRDAKSGNLDEKIQNDYLLYLLGSSTPPLKDHEYETLQAFTDYIKTTLDGFYLGYSIPQIGKEFDLIQLGEIDSNKYILNIELKSESSPEEIQKQLQRNRYYLNFTQRELQLYAFDAAKKTLYKLEGDNVIPLKDSNQLSSFLENVHADTTTPLNSLFNPSNYLVSPFNTTEEFLKQEYFLTKHQEEIKVKILNFINSSPDKYFSSITGTAGTGKTLLTYDIAMTLIQQGKNVIILHCGPLNQGQTMLVEKHNWNIKCAKCISRIQPNNYDVIIIDEAQRIRDEQWKKAVELQTKCLFSFDEKQYLSKSERRESFKDQVHTLVEKNYYTLTDKIRTNKEIADFLKQLFDLKKNFQLKAGSNNIEVVHFNYAKDINRFITTRHKVGWVTPMYTPTKTSAEVTFYYEEYFRDLPQVNAHSVIGQEYDSVVAVIDHNFFYDVNGLLKARAINSFDTYSLERMFYQIVTRTRKNLCIAILNNKDVFSRCLDILIR